MIILCIVIVFQTAAFSEVVTQGSVTGGSYIKVTDPEDDSNEVYKLISDGNVELRIPITPINGGIIELSYRMRFEGIGDNIIYMPMIVHDDGNIVNPMYHKGGLAIFDGTNMTFFRTYYENTWYKLRYVIDTEELKFDVYVNDNIICRNYTFTTAVTDEINCIKTSISRGSLYLDDITVQKVDESSQRYILFNSQYHTDHTNKTIGNLPYRMTLDDFIGTLKLKEGVSVLVSTQGRFIEDGDIMNVHDDIYNNDFQYTLKVRTLNCSLMFFKNFQKSIVLKENAPYCYINGEYTEICGLENNILSKEALNRYGITVNDNINILNVSSLGLYYKQYDNGYAILSKTTFSAGNIFAMNWEYDIEKLF